MRSPWKHVGVLDPAEEYVVLASSIPPKSITSTFRLFAGERAVRKQLGGTDGVIGFASLAEPLRKHYATLSIWRDDDALATFAASEPHGRLMVDLAPAMGETKFVRWTIRGADGVPDWNDALRRLGEP